MSDQIIFAWNVDVANTVFGPTQAAAALGAVPLCPDFITDPVLGQQLGLTLALGGRRGESVSEKGTLLDTTNMNTLPYERG
jgi:hypothetical protein